MFQGHFAELSQVRMHYLDEGAGEAVVLLHGWPQTSYSWRHVIPTLAQRFRVIAPDLRGFGDSSKPSLGYDYATIAGDVIELLNRIGVHEFQLVGHDCGGPIAFTTALLARSRVQKLALVNALSLHGEARAAGAPSRSDTLSYMDEVEALEEALANGESERYLAELYDTHRTRDAAVSADDLAEYVRCYAKPGARLSTRKLKQAQPVSSAVIDTLLAVKGKPALPVLSISGAGVCGRHPGQRLADFVTDLSAYVIPQCGHFVSEEAPDELCHLLLPFLGKTVR